MMRLADRRGLKLALLIILPIALATLGTIRSASTMLDGVAASVNRQEETRAWQAVQSAFASAVERLAGTVTDNAHWDDAAKQVYGPIDANWIEDTWGFPTTDINFDTMYVVDATGDSIIGYQQGDPAAVTPVSYFGPTLPKLLATLPHDGSTFATISTLVNTPTGLSIMAAAPILPTSEDLHLPTGQPRYLIFAKTLTRETLAKMGKQYIVDDLAIIPANASRKSGNILTDHWGQPVAQAVWKARHPGDAARQNFRSGAIAIILILIGVMLPITIVHAFAMTKMERDERKAHAAARQDALSGLPNRVFLLEALTEQLTDKNAELALIFIDLDGFKAVNDAYDHETGDKLIRAVAAGLKTLTGDRGTVARLGGDEFAILISRPDALATAQAIAQDVLAFVKEPFDIEGRIAGIGASIGIAERNNENLEPSELMRRADVAMYEAKENGRNRCKLFDRALDLKRSEDLAIANELRSFIAQGVFEVAYQPMVDSRSREIVGVEALARWPKGSQRSLSPDRFIPVAEEHGLIDALGRLIVQIACRDIAQWQDLKLAINVSPLQLSNKTFVSDLRQLAEESGLALDRLEVEFTESVLIKNKRRAKQVIEELQALGITVALDDFGTGYASVGYLREFAFDKIKLDRSLTQAVLVDSAAQQVVQGTVLIAKGLSATIIAEGVETEEEAQLMRLSGCHQLQGYYFGKPQEAVLIGAVLTRKATETVSISANG